MAGPLLPPCHLVFSARRTTPPPSTSPAPRVIYLVPPSRPFSLFFRRPICRTLCAFALLLSVGPGACFRRRRRPSEASASSCYLFFTKGAVYSPRRFYPLLAAQRAEHHRAVTLYLLLGSSLRNEVKGLVEVEGLLRELRGAWASIAGTARPVILE